MVPGAQSEQGWCEWCAATGAIPWPERPVSLFRKLDTTLVLLEVAGHQWERACQEGIAFEMGQMIGKSVALGIFDSLRTSCISSMRDHLQEV